MLELKDFFHLPEVDTLVEQIVANAHGLTLVAGLDPRPLAAPVGGFLPSGRSAIFGALVRQVLAARRPLRAVLVAETKDAVRIPNPLRRTVDVHLDAAPEARVELIGRAAARQVDLLVVDRLVGPCIVAALEAARMGVAVLSQLDTVFCGSGVARHLLDLGMPPELLDGLAWVVAVQRLPVLCPTCKQPEPVDFARLDFLRCRYPGVPLDGPFFTTPGCPACDFTGRHGDVAAFDIFRGGPDPAQLLTRPSMLSWEEYMLRLAGLGYLALDDAARFDAEQLHRTYSLLSASEHALSAAVSTLQRKLAELEAADHVLRQRTDALISLQDISRTLIASDNLDDLAGRLCRYARELCGADRAILYYLRPDFTAEVLATSGWPNELAHRRLDAGMVLGTESRGSTLTSAEPTPFPGWPPGISPRSRDIEGVDVRAGLRMPLVAQHEVVGLMIVHSTQKAQFAPGEVAMLQALANQAALALQRTGLIEALRSKIAELEAAQAELVKKERLERELELARQVQQSLLPRIFPLVAGFEFAARSEPARQVGGDFYDVILLDAGRVAVVIGDVSDKGMPAALFMALTRSLILAEARRERSPRGVLSNVHRLLLELAEPNMFVTVFYGVIDVPERRLTYARAGHDRPLVLRGGQTRSLGGEGNFLGFLDVDEWDVTEEQAILEPGDRLVLYTDGLIDARSPDGRPVGLGTLSYRLEAAAGAPLQRMLDLVFAYVAAHQHTAEQYDDMTMLIVEVKPA